MSKVQKIQNNVAVTDVSSEQVEADVAEFTNEVTTHEPCGNNTRQPRHYFEHCLRNN